MPRTKKSFLFLVEPLGRQQQCLRAAQAIAGAGRDVVMLEAHWAGTETATVWSGYMEGALQAAERAAAEALESGRPVG